MNASSKTAKAWCVLIARLALVLALVLSQGAAVVPVTAQGGGRFLVETHLIPVAHPRVGEPAPSGLTTAASAIQEVISTYFDEYISSNSNNYGFELSLKLGYDHFARQRALIEPSLSNVPPNATINTAKLRIYLCGYFDYVGDTRTINFYRVTSPWHQSLATGKHQPAKGEAVGSIQVYLPASLDPLPYYDVNVTSVVSNWVKGVYPNYGLMLTGLEGPEDSFIRLCSNDEAHYPTLTVDYTLTSPTLAAEPTELGFTNMPGNPTSAAKALILNNKGSTPFNWQASTTSGWISFSPSSGQVWPGSSQTISVSVNSTGLGEGVHSGQITVATTTQGAAGFPKNIPVTFSMISFDEQLMLPLISKIGTSTQPPAATQDVATLIIGIADYLHLTVGGGTPDERAGEWGEDLYYAGLDSTKETRTLGVFGLHHAANESSCGGGAGGGGLAPSSLPDAKNNILTLTDSQATLENIQAAFAWLDDHEGPNTTVQIFYSGHGGKTLDWDGPEDEPTDGLDEFIAAYDTNYVGGDYVNTITDDLLNTWLNNLESTHVAVLLDSCFSGGMIGPSAATRSGLIRRGLPLPASAGASASTDPAIELAADLAKSGRDILTASTVNESSYEMPELQQGVFSYYLMMALLDPGTDTNHDTIISVQEAYNYLSGRVSAYIASIPDADPQTPQYYPGASGSVGLSWSTAATSPCK